MKRTFLVVLLLFASSLTATRASNQVVTDTGDSGGPNQLRAKIATAQSSGGGAITFTTGTATIVLMNGALPSITTNTVIDGGNKITISGNNAFQIFSVNNGATLTLNNITISRGFNDGDGGAIVNSGTLNINSSKFLDNKTTSAWSGGAILSLGSLNITNSEFGFNQAGNGGALYPRFVSSATTITGSNFHDNTTLNTTNGWGGAMLLWDGAQVTVQNSQFTNNMANSGDFSSSTIDRGGAIYVTFNSSSTVDNSQFAGNSAFFGGAIYVDAGGTLTLTRSELHDNSIGVFDGTQGGGAIYNGGILTIDTDQLHDNRADGSGAAIENIASGSLTVRNSVLRHNQGDSGGAIENSGNATVETSTLADNSATNYGGAIDAADRTDTSKSMTLTASTLSGNSAGLHGGAIESEMKLTLTNVTLSGNTGPEIIDHYTRLITLTNVTLAQNTGRGLSLQAGATLALRNTLLASNAGGNCSGAVTSSGFNLADDTSCGLTNTGDHQGAGFNPHLGPLQNNGGPTETQLPGSAPAIDGGTPIGAPGRDQRGYLRAGAAPDIGAAEFGGALPHSLGNISTRAFVQTGNNVMIGGLIVSGGGPKKIILRALGPTLAQPPFNVPNALANPLLELHASTGALITSNDNWGSAANAAAISSSGFAPPNNLESAVLTSLNPGNYTAIVRGVNNTTGVALIEAYDLDSTAGSEFGNISTRGFVQTGNNVMIAGVIVKGPDSENVLIRGLGPTLSQFGVTNVLADPTLDLRDANGNLISSNDNWKDTQQTQIQATGLAPPNDKESAISATLSPANYTAILRGKNNTTGNGLVEVYALN